MAKLQHIQIEFNPVSIINELPCLMAGLMVPYRAKPKAWPMVAAANEAPIGVILVIVRPVVATAHVRLKGERENHTRPN